MEIIATHSFRGGSGKSFIALNMAAVSARGGIKTIIMDCDYGSPSFQSNLPILPQKASYGEDFLLGQREINEVICPTGIMNLDAIFANPKPRLGEKLLVQNEEVHWRALQRFSQIREDLEREGYRRLFLDTSPNLTYTSVSALTIADSIILVHRPVKHSMELTLYVIHSIYTTLKKSLKARNFYLIYNQVPHGTPEKVKNLLDSLTNEFKNYIEIDVLDTITLDPRMDFWESLLIREGSPILNKFTQMIDKITSRR